MGDVHRLLEEKGRKGAIETNLISRDVLEAAHLYLSDEESALAFAYSGWAQCALPHRRLPVSEPWEVKSDRMRLVVEPGRRPPTGASSDGPLEWVGVPFGAYARLILLYLQTQALKTSNREVELGRSWRDWMMRIGIPWGGRSGRGVREQAELPQQVQAHVPPTGRRADAGFGECRDRRSRPFSLKETRVPARAGSP